jgi:hypothetical protein
MKKKAKAPKTPKVAPKDHPPAWSSVLWPHLDTIRSLRRQRKTWLAITEHLKNDHGITITHRSVRNFFKRSVNVKLPLGFEDPVPSPPVTPHPTNPAADAPAMTFKDKLLAKKPLPKPDVFGRHSQP